MRVVIDTCVWVAAIRSRRGAGFALLTELGNDRFRFGIFVPLFVEYRAQMLATVVAGGSTVTANVVDNILAALAHYGTEVPIYCRLRPNLRDESDNMVFECAANFRAEAVVTHNVRDFRKPELKGYGIEVLRHGAFLRRVRRMP